MRKGGTTGVELRRTEDLSSDDLAEIRALMDDVFGDEFSEDDWEHALGGVHARAYDGDQLVAHGSLVGRQLMLGERVLNAGYVEAVAVRPDHQRQGYGKAIMETLERVIVDEYELGALSATGAGAGLYAARGWIRWEGHTSVLTPAGAIRTRENDRDVYVFPLSNRLNPRREITCTWRRGDPW